MLNSAFSQNLMTFHNGISNKTSPQVYDNNMSNISHCASDENGEQKADYNNDKYVKFDEYIQKMSLISKLLQDSLKRSSS